MLMINVDLKHPDKMIWLYYVCACVFVYVCMCMDREFVRDCVKQNGKTTRLEIKG